MTIHSNESFLSCPIFFHFQQGGSEQCFLLPTNNSRDTFWFCFFVGFSVGGGGLAGTTKAVDKMSWNSLILTLVCRSLWNLSTLPKIMQFWYGNCILPHNQHMEASSSLLPLGYMTFPTRHRCSVCHQSIQFNSTQSNHILLPLTGDMLERLTNDSRLDYSPLLLFHSLPREPSCGRRNLPTKEGHCHAHLL